MGKIVISGGDKGGVGKSMASALAADILIAAGQTLLIIEGDAAMPDIALRFSTCVQVETTGVNLNRAGDQEAAITRLGNALEKAADQRQDVLINLPAGSADTLDDLAPVIREIADASGFTLRVLYSLGPHRSSTDSLIKSLTQGLLGSVDPIHRTIVFPAFLGSPESFDWLKHPNRPAFMATGGRETVVPALRPDTIRDQVLAAPGTFTALGENKEALTLTERALFKRWLTHSHTAMAAALDD